MQANECILNLQKKIDDIVIESTNENDVVPNTRRSREQLVRLAHYYHLLTNMGDTTISPEIIEKTISLAKKKIHAARDYEGRLTEIAQSYLIDEHTKAWNMAEYYYEKGSKILCQMMITVMDYILVQKNQISVLYKGKNKADCLNLLEEMETLNKDYLSCFCFLCSYDFCTEKIADFTGIEEYLHLLKEHERIDVNGLPEKVIATLEALINIDSDLAKNVQNVCKPFPPYLPDALELIYNNVLSDMGGETRSMTVFSYVVIKVDEFYELFLKDLLYGQES